MVGNIKILIAGVTSRVGTLLTHNLLQDGHEIIAGARHPERVENNDRITPVKFDLHESVVEMTKAIKGAEAIYFAAGTGAKDLLQVDAVGAVKPEEVAPAIGRAGNLPYHLIDKCVVRAGDVYDGTAEDSCYQLRFEFFSHDLSSKQAYEPRPATFHL